MNLYKSKLEHAEALDLEKLPSYGFSLFFKRIGPFKGWFVVLSILGILASILLFSITYLISEIINNYQSINPNDVLSVYLPFFLFIYFTTEVIGYIRRRYAEAIPDLYKDYIVKSIILSLLKFNSYKFLNYSKEKLAHLIDKYASSAFNFLTDWVWRLPKEVTSLVIVVLILGKQNIVVLVITIVYMLIFLTLSINISKHYSVIWKKYLKSSANTASVNDNFFLQFSTIKRLNIAQFYSLSFNKEIAQKWVEFEKVRNFHAKRWFLQLNLFNFIYIGVLIYGIYQISLGTLELGFIVLIKYAFDSTWSIMQYIIEYAVRLISEKETQNILEEELKQFITKPAKKTKIFPVQADLILEEVKCVFRDKDGKKKSIEIPKLEIKPGDKIVITGESGSGKSTIMAILLNLIEFKGKYLINGKSVDQYNIERSDISLINNSDNFFNLSVKDNLLLGNSKDDGELNSILDDMKVTDFLPDINNKLGDIGTNFSAGQYQRLRLARGLVNNSQIYLLDEPFNGIDSKTKDTIMKNIQKRLQDNTVILVTHNKEELNLFTNTKRYSFDGNVLKAIE